MSFAARYCTWRVRENSRARGTASHRSSAAADLDTAAVRAAETVMRGLTTTGGIRSSAAPCVAIGKPGCGVCSAAARHYLD
jgi:hypothetical protein